MRGWLGTGAARRSRDERAHGRADRGLLALVAVLLCSSIAVANQQTRRSMQDIFAAMQLLLPASLSAERFAQPELQPKIDAALSLLEESSAQLASHGMGADASFELLGTALAADAKDVHARWKRGQHEESRFIIQQMTETCMACHSRLPSGDSALSKGFVDEAFDAELELSERARLQYATRQFDQALTSYEAMLASKEIASSDLDLGGYLDEYLELCVRVRVKPERAEGALRKLLARKDLRSGFRRDVESWIASFKELSGDTRPDDSIAAAETLLAEAEDRGRFADEREALVYYLESSGMLYRALDASIDEKSERARAYYLLGVIDTRIGRTFWLSQAETLLEAAIRTDPHSQTARDAYAVLEEFMIAGYTGSGGTRVPREVQELLAELAQLVDEDDGESVPGASST